MAKISPSFSTAVVCVAVVLWLVASSEAKGGGKDKKRVKVTAPAPSARRFVPHNYTDLLSPHGHPWGCITRAIDNNNFLCLDEVLGYGREQRLIGESIFDADDSCYHGDPMAGDTEYLQLLELSGGGWGGVGQGGSVTDSCGPTYGNIICFSKMLARRAARDKFFHPGENDTVQVCQEGFNTGREAYAWLAADPRVKVLAFDVERDATYVRKAAEFITSKFGAGRFELVSGNLTHFLMPQFQSTHRDFAGCDILALTGTAAAQCDRARAIRAWKGITNSVNLIVSDNTLCSSGFCVAPTHGTWDCHCGLTPLYVEYHVTYHETQHRARHNGAFKIVNAPHTCGFEVLAVNVSVPNEKGREVPCTP